MVGSAERSDKNFLTGEKMINTEIEDHFADCYIEKEFRERFKFELKDVKGSEPKRTFKAFAKLAHSSLNYLKKSRIVVCDEALTENDVLKLMKAASDKDVCYYMDGSEGVELSVTEALRKTFDHYGASVIVVKDKCAFIKEESSVGSPKKIFLKI